MIGGCLYLLFEDTQIFKQKIKEILLKFYFAIPKLPKNAFCALIETTKGMETKFNSIDLKYTNNMCKISTDKNG